MKNLIFVLAIFLHSCNAREDKRLVPPQPTVMQEKKTDGEILFKNNCANCHKPDKDFTGPALMGSLQRWDYNKKAMYDFIRNPGKSINKSKYVKDMSNKWGPALMTAFPNLSDKELDAIMSYCDNYISTILKDSVVVCAF